MRTAWSRRRSLLLRYRMSFSELLTSTGKEKSQRSATRSTPREPAARMTMKGWSMVEQYADVSSSSQVLTILVTVPGSPVRRYFSSRS